MGELPGVDDRIRDAAETIWRALIEAELTSVVGALGTPPGPDAPNATATGDRPLSTTAVDLELRIPWRLGLGDESGGGFSPAARESGGCVRT
jgi:hypothetical protein